MYHGTDGPVKVTSNRLYSKCPMFPAFIRAGIQAGYKYNPDFNGATQEGVGWIDSNVSNGIRQSASRCYLLPALSRKNLHVISNATVSRVLLQDKRAVGVEYTDSNGEKLVLKAKKEVLLCGGVYNTPQILMLSGLGDPAALQEVASRHFTSCRVSDTIFRISRIWALLVTFVLERMYRSNRTTGKITGLIKCGRSGKVKRTAGD